ncbi:MAG TPA: acetolactate synthase large subunit [Actinomycetota bacterium]|nr:acetolactate synthase large subunit [Actinomycetota bacterium]
MGSARHDDVAHLLVRCLENEGVRYVFGLPGEENLAVIDALAASSIRFITTRDERGAAFMADSYGALTGQPGVCLATLGPGAINLLLGVANAQLDSHPLVAITAQAALARMSKESHQAVDLVSLFRPVAKWGDMVTVPETVPEMMRKAFKQAATERPGATFIVVPEDVAERRVEGLEPLPVNVPVDPSPSLAQVERAAALLSDAERPVVLAGPGVARDDASGALVRFAERLGIPVVTTFLGKGVFPDDHELAVGTIGFMVRDYANFGFDTADVVVAVGYDLVEYPPVRWNPDGTKRVIHVHRDVAEVDASYVLSVGVVGNIAASLDAIATATDRSGAVAAGMAARGFREEELAQGAKDASFPLRPQRIVADIRQVVDRDGIVLVDTGAAKMWMARLYPTYEPNTCLISNGLATMAFSLPGAIAAKLVHPERQVLAVMGDGAFLMSAADIETAVRERIALTVLVWVDGGYGLIGWKQDLHFARNDAVRFGNPDFVRFAESFGARGHAVTAADELLPTLREALAHDGVSIVACPVDYSENARLVARLGGLAEPAEAS